MHKPIGESKKYKVVICLALILAYGTMLLLRGSSTYAAPTIIIVDSLEEANMQIIHTYAVAGGVSVTYPVCVYIYDEKYMLIETAELEAADSIIYAWVNTPGYYYATAYIDGFKTTVSSVYTALDAVENPGPRAIIGSPGDVPEWESPNPSKPFGSVNDIGTIIFGNMGQSVPPGSSQFLHSEGGFWVRGNVYFENVNLDFGAPNALVFGGDSIVGHFAQIVHPRFMAGGDVTLANVGGVIDAGKIFLHGGSMLVSDGSIVSYVETVGGSLESYYEAPAIDIDSFFSQAEADLRELNSWYSGASTSGRVYVHDLPPYTSDDATSGFYEIDFPAVDHAAYDTIIFNLVTESADVPIRGMYIDFPYDFYGNYVINVIPAAGTQIVKFGEIYGSGSTYINGSDFGWEFIGGGMRVSEYILARQYCDRIIWNIDPSVTDVEARGHMFIGSVLAPLANFNILGNYMAGNVNGQLVCNDLLLAPLVQGWEQHTTSRTGYGNVAKMMIESKQGETLAMIAPSEPATPPETETETPTSPIETETPSSPVETETPTSPVETETPTSPPEAETPTLPQMMEAPTLPQTTGPSTTPPEIVSSTAPQTTGPPTTPPEITPSSTPLTTGPPTTPPDTAPPITPRMTETPLMSREIYPREPPMPPELGHSFIPDGDGWIVMDIDGTLLGRWEWDEEQWIFKGFPLGTAWPQTGDDASFIPYFFLLGFSLMGIGIVLRTGKAYRHKRRARARL